MIKIWKGKNEFIVSKCSTHRKEKKIVQWEEMILYTLFKRLSIKLTLFTYGVKVLNLVVNSMRIAFLLTLVWDLFYL